MRVLLASLLFVLGIIELYGQRPDIAHADFRKADSVAALYPYHSLSDLRILADKLTNDLPTEEEKFRSIYTWICKNVENDYDLFITNKTKRAKLTGEALHRWNETCARKMIRELIESRRTVCTGYAYLLKALSNHAGLSCQVIDGYGRNVSANIGGEGELNHSWNAISLHGEWYLCDPTWSSGAMDMDRRIFVKNYQDVYFLADPSLFIRNHYPLDTSWMFIEVRPSLREFLDGPLVYAAAFRYNVHPDQPGKFQMDVVKGATLRFQFESDEDDVKEAGLQLNQVKKTYPITHRSTHDGVNQYFIDQSFPRAGTYAVHMIIDGFHAVTYSVRVRR